MSHVAFPPEEALRQTAAVLDRLIPLTRPLSEAQPELHEHLAAAWADHIRALVTLERFADAESAASQWLAHLGDTPAGTAAIALQRWPQLAQALYEQAQVHRAAGEAESALAMLDTLQQRFAHAEALPVREWVARAGLAEVRLRGQRGATFARVDMVRRAHELAQAHAADDWPATRAVVAQLRLHQGLLLEALDYDDEALKEWTALWRDASTSAQDEVREAAADAKLEQGRLLGRLGRWPEAAESHRLLIETLAGSTHPGCRDTLALAHLDHLLWQRDERLPVPYGRSAQQEIAHACAAMQAAFASGRGSTVVDRCLSRCLAMHANALREQAEEADEGVEVADPAPHAQAQALAQTLWSDYADHLDPQVRRTTLDAWIDAIDHRALPPAARLVALQDVLRQRGDDQAEELQALLVYVWTGVAVAQHKLAAHEEAQATMTAMQTRFAQATGIEVRRSLGHQLLTQARWLGEEQHRFDDALALLGTDAREFGAEEPDRWLKLLHLDARADLWAMQTAPKHPHPNGKDASGQPLAVEPTAAELAYADAIDQMAKEFGRDDSRRIRQRLAQALYGLAVHQREHLHFEAALATYRRQIDLFQDDADPDTAYQTASASLNLAYLLMELLERPAEALPLYDTLLERCGHHAEPRWQGTLAKASASRLTCLNRLQRQGAAISYGEGLEDLPLEQRDALRARLDAARAHHEKGQRREAIALYDEILAAHQESPHPELRRLCLDAMVSKGYCLGQLGQREQALAVNDEILARYGHERNITTEKDVALALSNKAVQLDRLGRHEEEMATYDQIIQRWKHSDVAYLRMRVASAMHAKGLTVAERDPMAAEALYRETVDRALHASDTGERLQAAKSVVSLAALLRKSGRHADAVAACEGPLALLEKNGQPEIAAQLQKIRVTLARSLRDVGQRESALRTYQVLLEEPLGALDESLLTSVRREYAELGGGRSWREKATHWLIRAAGKRAGP